VLDSRGTRRGHSGAIDRNGRSLSHSDLDPVRENQQGFEMRSSLYGMIVALVQRTQPCHRRKSREKTTGESPSRDVLFMRLGVSCGGQTRSDATESIASTASPLTSLGGPIGHLGAGRCQATVNPSQRERCSCSPPSQAPVENDGWGAFWNRLPRAPRYSSTSSLHRATVKPSRVCLYRYARD